MIHIIRIDWKVFLIITLTALFQMSIMPWFSIIDIAPNLCFLFLSFYAFQINHHQIFMMAFMTGLMRDLMSQAFFGLETVSLVFGSLILHQMASRLDRNEAWVQFWGVFLFSFTTLLIYLALATSIQQTWLLNGYQLIKAVLIAAYSTLLMFVVFPLLRKWFRVTGLEKQYELF